MLWASPCGGHVLGDPVGRPLPGDLKDSPPLCLSPQSWTLPAPSPGDRSLLWAPLRWDGLRCAAPLPVPSREVQGAALPLSPPCLSLCYCNKQIRVRLSLSVWLLSQWTRELLALLQVVPPLQPSPQGDSEPQPLPGIPDSVCEAASAGPWEGGASGCQPWSEAGCPLALHPCPPATQA